MMPDLYSAAMLGTGLLEQANEGAVAQASEATGIPYTHRSRYTHLLSTAKANTVAVSLHTVAVGSCSLEDSHVRAFKAEEK